MIQQDSPGQGFRERARPDTGRLVFEAGLLHRKIHQMRVIDVPWVAMATGRACFQVGAADCPEQMDIIMEWLARRTENRYFH
jgi:hypothetical protein